MRGTDHAALSLWQDVGITPAHAGNSHRLGAGKRYHGDHPRTCGEQLFLFALVKTVKGSPPHMRGTDWLKGWSTNG